MVVLGKAEGKEQQASILRIFEGWPRFLKVAKTYFVEME